MDLVDGAPYDLLVGRPLLDLTRLIPRPFFCFLFFLIAECEKKKHSTSEDHLTYFRDLVRYPFFVHRSVISCVVVFRSSPHPFVCLFLAFWLTEEEGKNKGGNTEPESPDSVLLPAVFCSSRLLLVCATANRAHNTFVLFFLPKFEKRRAQ